MGEVLKKVLGVLIACVLIALVFMVTFSFYKDVSFGANIEEYTLLNDETALIKLSAGANSDNITSVIFVFNDSSGKSYYYETSDGAQNLSVPYTTFLLWKSLKGEYVYPINASDLGLDNFNDITSVEVIFKYESSEESNKVTQTRVLDVKQIVDGEIASSANKKSSGGGSSSGGSGSGNSKGNNNTSPIVNGTNETIGNNTGEVGNETNVTLCSPRNSCESECGTISNNCGGWLYCGECSVPCDLGVNCFYVSVNGSGNRSGSLGNEMNLTEARRGARAGYTFLLLSGNYGMVTFGQAWNYYGSDHYATNWSMPITYRAASGAEVVFSRLSVFAHGDEPTKERYLILEGINIIDSVAYTPVTVSSASSLRLINLTIIGTTGNYTDDTSMYGIIVKNTDADYFLKDILIEGLDISHAGTGMALQGRINNLIVRNNRVHDTHGSAISPALSPESGPTLIENNIIHDQNPLPTRDGKDWNHGSGISIHSNNLTVRNNTIYDYGNTRPIRTYQGANESRPVTGPNGYENMLFENNLVYYTNSNKYNRTYNTYVDFIDAGRNFIVRNNTFTGGFGMNLAPNYDGSQTFIYNNLMSSFGVDNPITVTSGSQTCEQANIFWKNIYEMNNVYNNVPTASGNGWLCWYDKFNSNSNSISLNSVKRSFSDRTKFMALFVNNNTNDFHPSSSKMVCNGTLWNTPVGVPAAGALSCK